MPLSLLRPSALRRFDHYVLALMATLATGGCAGTVRTPYVPPTLPVAPAWPESAAAPSAPAGRIAWWREAGDAALIRLVERVIAANPNLAAAGIRLHQARLSASLAARQLTPALGANLSGDRRIPLSGAPGTEASGIALTASWEADLFGKLDAQRDAARWEAAATAADLAATRQSLIATTATAWFQLALANERLANGAASIGAAQHTLTLVHTQHRAGAVSSLELRDSEQALAAQQAAQAGFAQARSEARNALAADTFVGEAGIGQGLIEGRADRRLLCIVEQLGIDCAPSAIDEPIEFCACGRHQPETVKRGAGRKTRGDLLFELRPVPARDHRHIRDGEQSGEGCGHIFR